MAAVFSITISLRRYRARLKAKVAGALGAAAAGDQRRKRTFEERLGLKGGQALP